MTHTSESQTDSQEQADTHPRIPVTSAGRAYVDSAHETLALFHFVLDTTLTVDYVAHIAKEALDGKTLSKGMTPADLAGKKPGARTLALRRRSQALMEMILSRIVDNFTTYLSEIVREALVAKPEMLRSAQQIRIDYALGFPTMDELREDLIDRKVLELSYLGFAELAAWCSSRMGVDLIPSGMSEDQLIELIETRNVIAHNRSRIGPKYLKLVTQTRFKRGDIRTLDPDYLFAADTVLESVFIWLDQEVAAKFGLSRVLYEPVR